MKTIPGFSDYSITMDGRVWSQTRLDFLGHNRKGRWLKPELVSGYFRVVLCENNKIYKRLVHRLVLRTYVGLCPAGMECRHLNGVRTDNRLINLCWGTHQENVQDSVKNRTYPYGEKCYKTKLKEHQVILIRFLRNIAKFSGNDLAYQFNTTRSNIYAICNGHSWKHLLNNG